MPAPLDRPALPLALLLLATAALGQPRPGVTLRWKPVSDAVAYELEIAKDPAFQRVVLREKVTVTGYRWGELPTATYHWRVRSLNSEGRAGEWIVGKQIEPEVNAPSIQRPAQDELVLLTAAPYELVVQESKTLRGYVVELAADPAFARDVRRQRSDRARIPLAFSALGTFYVRVRGVDLEGRETAPSAARKLEVRLAPPTLVAPAAGAALPWTDPPPAVKLEWADVRAATGYQVELSGDGRPTATQSTRKPLLEVRPEGPGGYSWRVRAVAGAATSDWSPPQPFTLGLASPQLVAPAADAQLGSRRELASVELSWTEVPGASAYLVEVSRDAAFSSVATSQRQPAPAHAWTAVGLSPGSYQWRVSAEDAAGHITSASPPWAFRIVGLPPLAAPAPLRPRAGEVVPTGAGVTLEWAAVPDAAEYEVAVDALSATGDPSAGRTSSTSLHLAAPPEGEFAWRVRAVDATGAAGSWSERLRFSHGLPASTRAELRSDRTTVAADGRSSAIVTVKLFDAQGRLVRGARPEFSATAGRIAEVAEQDGTFRARYVAPEQMPQSGLAWVMVRDRGFEATLKVPLARPGGAFRIGAAVGWNTSFGTLSSPYLGLRGHARLPLLEQRLGIAARLGGYFGARSLSSPVGPLEASSQVGRASLLLVYELPLAIQRITPYLGAGPSLQLVRARLGGLVTYGAVPGAQVSVGALRPWGPGAVTGELSYAFGRFQDADLSLNTGGLSFTVGYEVPLP